MKPYDWLTNTSSLHSQSQRKWLVAHLLVAAVQVYARRVQYFVSEQYQQNLRDTS